MQEKQFKVGGRVVYVGEEIISEDVDKLLGTIVDIDVTDDARPYLVNFDTKIFGFDTDINGHTGGGKCPDCHGWWVDAADISLISCTGKSLKAYVPECSSNPHYETSVQPIEFMQANMTHEEFIGFLKGNIIKYTARCGKKDDVDKEVAKIIEYAKWLAKAYKGETIDPRES